MHRISSLFLYRLRSYIGTGLLTEYLAEYRMLKIVGYPAKLKKIEITISIHKISQNVYLKPLMLW
jgi:hypothetical protein